MNTIDIDREKTELDNTPVKNPVPNVGTGPASSIPDGGLQGEEKQRKENTGNMTEMGGATGGIPKSETQNPDNKEDRTKNQ